MTQYKRSYHMYSAWNYENEIESLNKASDEGWQLAKGGCFSSKFVYNPGIRYRYQLDFGNIEDMGRYIETFREQGWEYINSTFNGWHYLRKIYDPSLPQEEYEIFTDQESLHEMNSRWAKIALVVVILPIVLTIVNAVKFVRQPKLPTIIILITAAIESLVLLRGVLIMRDPQANRNRKGDSFFLTLFIAGILLGSFAYVTLETKRPHFTTGQNSASIDRPMTDDRWCNFDIPYTDNYYFNVEFRSSSPMTFGIVDEEGNFVYSQTGTSFHDTVKVKLKKGTYCYSLSYTNGFYIQCALE